jgi:hypothetical protein
VEYEQFGAGYYRRRNARLRFARPERRRIHQQFRLGNSGDRSGQYSGSRHGKRRCAVRRFLARLDISGNTITNIDGAPGLFIYYDAADNPPLWRLHVNWWWRVDRSERRCADSRAIHAVSVRQRSGLARRLPKAAILDSLCDLPVSPKRNRFCWQKFSNLQNSPISGLTT